MAKESLSEKLTKTLATLVTEQLCPNDKLPSERALSEQYHMSRNTVRAALNQLFLQGLIYRSPGKGTFVAEPLDDRADVAAAFSFTQQMGAMKRNPESKVVGLKQVPASPMVADHLRLNHGAAVYVLDRIRMADHRPMMAERSYLPAAVLPNLSKALLKDTPLYDLLEHHYGIHIATVDETFFADLMSAEYAQLLDVPPNSACLKIRRTAFTSAGNIIEYTMSAARADQFVYHVQHANH
ncbi:GntR family transcriptional regulator [Lacticaseibacillus camelliae]|nr:GntR family transcriptional regulator [Lacticaseibacillus camelliae]